MIIDKRTKIITTIGPASESKEKILALLNAGMNTIRLNFSHGDFEEQGARIKTVKQIRKELKVPISIMLDTKGPEIRVGKFVDGKQDFFANREITIYTDSKSYQTKVCDNTEMTVAYDMSQDLKPGKIILVDDGKLEMKVLEVKPGLIKAQTINHHLVKNNKRVNLPGTKFSMPFLATKDINDIKFGCDMGIDFIAASFVNTAKDIIEIREILKAKKAEHIKIFAKIESQYAVDNFAEILEATDGVMVARGDLGLEIPYYEVPVVEKMIIRKMREAGKPVIVATQMLDSMEKNPHPTRAEVTDVYLATELGADATMLSGESAAGEYPVEAVHVMATINQRAEKEFFKKVYYDQYLKTLPFDSTPRGLKAKEVTLRAQNGDYKFTIVLSRTGQLLSKVASLRPNTLIIGVTNDPKQLTLFGSTSGVFVHQDINAFTTIKKDKTLAREVAQIFKAQKGDKYLVVENNEITEFIF